jgi:hypothetical protein
MPAAILPGTQSFLKKFQQTSFARSSFAALGDQMDGDVTLGHAPQLHVAIAAA